MKMQRYVIKDSEDRILSVFKTNSAPPPDAIPIDDDVEIDDELYAGDEPRLRSPDNRQILEDYPKSPGADYEWNETRKEWEKRPPPVDEIADLKRRVKDLEDRRA